MISAVRAVVPQGMTPEKALETFEAVKCECDAEGDKEEVIY
jgi:hypothetical protein